MEDLPILYRIFRRFECRRIDKVSQLLEGRNLNILEIGCADGEFIFKNRNIFKKITGVDTDDKKNSTARKRNYKVPAQFLTDDFGRKKMPFISGSFDTVVSIATLQYVYNLDLLISEVYRSLKNGGLFIFEVPNAAVFWRRLYFLFGRLPRTSTDRFGWDSDVIHYFTVYDLKKYFYQNSKFKIEKITGSGIFDWIREKWVSVLSADIIFVLRKV